MALKDLQARQGNVDVEVQVIEKGAVREFQKFGKSGKVCNAKVKDDSGEMSLTLWNDESDRINVGDRIRIQNGYVGEWQGEPQLSTGRFGKIEILESKGAAKEEKRVETKPKTGPEEEIAEEEDLGE
jgi:ssDNA-binding replication factor A large subunit